jgi:hypothetical protein
MIRGRQDRKAAMICFSTIQKQELRRDRDGLWALFMEACSDLGVEFLGMDGLATPQRPRESQQASSDDDRPALEVRIPMESEDGDRHWWSFRIVENTGLESDIVLRYLSRLVRSTAEKIEDLSPRPSSVDDASDLPELGSSDVEPPHPLRSTPTLENAAKVV